MLDRYIAGTIGEVLVQRGILSSGFNLLVYSNQLERLEGCIDHLILLPSTNFLDILYLDLPEFSALLTDNASNKPSNVSARRLLPYITAYLEWKHRRLWFNKEAFNESIEFLNNNAFSKWKGNKYRQKEELVEDIDHAVKYVYLCHWLLDISNPMLHEDMDVVRCLLAEDDSIDPNVRGKSIRWLLKFAVREINRLKNNMKVIPNQYISRNITAYIHQETEASLNAVWQMCDNLRAISVQEVGFVVMRDQLLSIAKNIASLVLSVRQARRELAKLTITTKSGLSSSIFHLTAISITARALNNNEQIAVPHKLIAEPQNLLDILTAVHSGALSPTEATSSIERQPHLKSFINTLTGQEVRVKNTVVSFGQNNNVGDIKIRDIAAGNILHLTVNISNINSNSSP